MTIKVFFKNFYLFVHLLQYRFFIRYFISGYPYILTDLTQ